MSIQAIGSNVILKEFQLPSSTGIIVMDKRQDYWGEVVSVGDSVTEVKVGQVVAYRGFDTFVHGKEAFLVGNEKNILAVMDKKYAEEQTKKREAQAA